MRVDSLSRAGIRRLLALHPDGRRLALRPSLVAPEIAGPLPPADTELRFADYVLDGAKRPLIARGPGDEAWFERSLLLRRIVPGSAVAISDEVAAIIAAPSLVDEARLSTRALAHRFASRADDVLAAAVSLLAPDAAVATIFELALRHGPDEDRLHLALLQAGRALAWRPELLEADKLGTVVDALLDLLDRRSPRPLLDALAPILGAFAASLGTVGKATRSAVLARLGEMRRRIVDRRSGSSFLDEFRALDRPRTVPDEDYYFTLADRHVAEAAARILGRSAEQLDAAGFVALQEQVVADDFGSTLLPSFVDGLIDAAAIAPLGELAAHLLAARDEEPRLLGLLIAARVPLDNCADDCLASLEDDRRQIRTAAIRAVAMLEPERAVPSLIARLDDPDPGVCACAGRALVELGQRDQVDLRRMPGELAIGRTRERTAAARAALGDTSGDVVAALLPLVAAETEQQQTDAGDTPLVTALASILCGSADGIRLAAEVIRELPDALPIVALALAGDDEVPSVSLPTELYAELARSLDPIIAIGGEAGMLALETLARFSLGDATFVDRIIAAAVQHEGYAQHVLAALAYVCRRSERAATVVAPWLDSHEYFAATLLAAGVAGVVLPEAHRLWGQIRALHELGTVAAATAYSALASGARVRWDEG